jgi:type IV secretion system protein TrbL
MSLDAGILDQVTDQFLTALKNDGAIIQQAAEKLFGYLVVIQLSISALWMTLAGESLQNFLTKMVQMAFVFGFFYALIQYASEWMPAVLNGFIRLGQEAGVKALDPSSIVDQGVSIASGIVKGLMGWGLLSHPFVSILGAIVCISIIVIYGLMAAELAIVLVKSYVLIAVGSLFFAFSASDVTRSMSTQYFKSILGLGLQLMTLYLLLGVGQHVGEHWAQMTSNAAAQHELMPMLVILCAVIVYYLILKNIPVFIGGLAGVGGLRNYGDTAVATTLGAAASGVGALATASRMAGGIIQGSGQFAHGISQTKKAFHAHLSNPDQPDVTPRKAAALTAKTVGSSGVRATKDSVMGTNKHLSSGQRFNQHLKNRINKVKDPKNRS